MTLLKDVFSGPARYRAETPWGPFQALLATVVIVVAPMLLVTVVMMVQGATGVLSDTSQGFMRDMMRLSTPTGVLVLGLSQLLSLALVWLFAGRQGMRWPTFSLSQPNPPSFRLCIALAVMFIVVMGLIEFVVYQFLKFDLFKDSKFLVEGLRSPMWPFTIFMAVVLAPLWEELTFRGFLMSALSKTPMGIVGGALISTTLWTLLHASYSIPALLSVFAAGLAISWLVWKTGSLRVAIVTHALVNASAATFAGVFAPAM